MSLTLPANARGPIFDLTLPASALALDIVLRNATTEKTMAINLPAAWAGDDLSLDFFRRTIRDQTGADRSALLDPEDNELWTAANPFIAGENDLTIYALDAAASQTATSFISPATVVNDSSVGTLAWTEPGNAKASDDVRATVAATKDQVTNYLRATGFAFGLPAGALITKIEPAFEGSSSTAVTVTSQSIRLVRGGKPVGEEITPAFAFISGTDSVKGTTPGLFGLTLTNPDLAASDFGVAVSLKATGTTTIRIDHISMRAWYRAQAAYVATATLRWEQGHY